MPRFESAFTEQVHVFGDAPCVGVMSLPDTPPGTAVIVVVGGPQYRAGSHRQFVQLCRAAASQGHAAFRFDYTGMGDTPGELNSFLTAGGDIAAAIDFVRRTLPSVQRIALWGLCDGASAALLYWHETRDPRVQGLCLLNPWVRSAVSQAQAQVKHYYARRLMQADFWRKLLSGRVAAKALVELARSLRTLWRGGPSAAGPSLPFQARMAEAWKEFPGAILLVLSGNDFTAKEFTETVRTDAAWDRTLSHPRLARHDAPNADHTFSDAASRLQLEAATAAWLTGLSR